MLRNRAEIFATVLVQVFMLTRKKNVDETAMTLWKMQGWDFALWFFVRIARFLRAKEQKSDSFFCFGHKRKKAG